MHAAESAHFIWVVHRLDCFDCTVYVTKTKQLGLCGTKIVWANTELKLRDDKKIVLPFKLKYISFMY